MSEIIFNTPTSTFSLQSQIDSLQTTLASLNQQVIILQETVQEKDQKIAQLEEKLTTTNQQPEETAKNSDNTLTIVGLLIMLYRFVFPAGKVNTA